MTRLMGPEPSCPDGFQCRTQLPVFRLVERQKIFRFETLQPFLRNRLPLLADPDSYSCPSLSG